MDSAAGMLRCSDPDQKPFDKPIIEADNWGCMSPEDWERILKNVAKKPMMFGEATQTAKKQLSANPFIKKKWEKLLVN